VGIVIIATITVIPTVIPIITGASLIRIATPGWLEAIRASLIFQRELVEEIRAARSQAAYFSYLGEAAGLVTGLLPGPSIWNSFLNC
jgi:hypothetical protein